MRKFPNALVIMLGFILFVSLLTYLLPKGAYQRIENPDLNYVTVVPDSYNEIEAAPLKVGQILLSIPEGIIGRAELIALIFLLGGAFYVVDKTGAFRDGIHYMTEKLTGKESSALAVISLLFTTGGALNGLQEEIIAMTPVLLFFAHRLGYNTLVAIGISYGSAVVGSSFSPMNPFAVGMAQKTAELPLFSGSIFRIIILILAYILWTGLVIRYANNNKVEKLKEESREKHKMKARNIAILMLTALAFIIVIYGLLILDWGFNEMSAEFFALGIIAGLVGRLGFNGTAEAYIEGFKEMTFAAIIIGLANSITLILKQGMIIDTIIYALFTPLQYLPKSVAAIAMMGAQALLHFPVPSYSAQAIMTMPILAPLSDLIGISRQVCILAYQYGAVMMDMIIPTNGALMAIISVAGISFNKWLGFAFRLTLVMLILGAVAVMVGIYIGY
ncbi:YfcC family protein [Echinicola marina]|uniref:YfcC family protein n=1 Tax=Echinicola marina TaxID=2859768 RepID=UPI001CF700B5|nr:Na+/H+ antiporter NhaC family protein [Echinicola marina]UCS94594.1 YfcC family protein [Echinicola marina]